MRGCQGTNGSNPAPSSGESVSRVALSSWSRTPAFRAGLPRKDGSPLGYRRIDSGHSVFPRPGAACLSVRPPSRARLPLLNSLNRAIVASRN